MKKENKQMAKQRRAEEREKEARKRSALHILTYWGPIALAVVVVVVLVVAIATSDRGGSAENADSDGAVAMDDGDDSDDGLVVDSDSEIVLYDEDDDSEVVLYDEEDDGDEGALNTEEGLEAALGDTVNIDFTGYVDGEEFEGGSTDGAGYDLELGSGSFIEGFEDGVVGHKVGETFDLNLKFPDPYLNDTSLSGKDVVFTTTLNGIYE